MIPVKLTIEGLYSYQERQVIDFDKLTSAGLFGIFGTTGSGKSSILEAISYALYGRTERLGGGDKRTYNMMNLLSNKTFLDLEFLNFKNQKYRVTREFKRNSKRFEEIRTPVVTFYKKKDDEWIPIEDTSAENILDLSYENFKRTVIIPQGQFKEFLELGTADRTRMMKEIFGLDRFDLQDKVKALRDENRSNLDQLTGRLQGFEEVSEGILKELKEKLDSEKDLKEKAELAFKDISDEFKKYEDLKAKNQTLKAEVEKLKEKQKEVTEVNAQKEKLDRYEETHKVFNVHLITKSDLEKEFKEALKIWDEFQEKVKKTEDELEEKNTEFERLKLDFEKLDLKKQEAVDLEGILRMKEFKGLIQNNLERLEKGENVIKGKEEDQKEIQEKIKAINIQVGELKTNRLDASLLLKVSDWYKDSENFQKEIENSNIKLKDLNQKISDKAAELKALEADIPDFEKEFEKADKKLKTQLIELEEKMSHLTVRQKLTEYADALHEGEACPLCGSLEHPDKISDDEVMGEIAKVNLEIENLKESQETLLARKSKVKGIFDIQKIYSEQKEDVIKQLEENKKDLENHLKSFKWEEFESDNPDKFNLAKKKSAQTEAEIKKREEDLEKLNSQLEKNQKELRKFEDEIQKIKDIKNEAQTKFDLTKGHLKLLKYSKFIETDRSEIEFNLKTLIANNQKIEKEYKELESKIHELNTQIAAEKASLAAAQKNWNNINKKLDSVNQEIDKLLIKTSSTLEVVTGILAEKHDGKAEWEKINDFFTELKTLEKKVSELKTELADFEDNPEVYKKKNTEFKEAENHFKDTVKKFTQTESEFKRLEKSYEEKKDLIKKQETLQKREDNLKILYNLMYASGFVQYASSLYLRQLCDRANVRFRQMTQNQLHLQLNNDYNFEVVDHLNGGESRSVKTLSGGQSFQAALSLALALAESVQSHTKARQNFFFIDEGFGTQDQEAVNVVFDTLMQLQKENRIVGIISHVDELKERMPIALEITKDEKVGSRLKLI